MTAALASLAAAFASLAEAVASLAEAVASLAETDASLAVTIASLARARNSAMLTGGNSTSGLFGIGEKIGGGKSGRGKNSRNYITPPVPAKSGGTEISFPVKVPHLPRLRDHFPFILRLRDQQPVLPPEVGGVLVDDHPQAIA